MVDRGKDAFRGIDNPQHISDALGVGDEGREGQPTDDDEIIMNDGDDDLTGSEGTEGDAAPGGTNTARRCR